MTTMPTRDELVRALAVDGIGGYSLVTLGKQADAVLALLAAQIAELTAEKERLRYIIVTGFDIGHPRTKEDDVPTRDELQRLSDAASPGPWSMDVRDPYMDGRSAIYVRGPEPGIRISMVSNVADVELAVALVNGWRDGSIVAAEPGVAVPEPDEQRCGHCDGTGEWVQPWGAGRVLIKDCEYCKGTGRPAASPVAQEDGEQK